MKDESVAPAAVIGRVLVSRLACSGFPFSIQEHTVRIRRMHCVGRSYIRNAWLWPYARRSNRGLALCLVLAAAWRVSLLFRPPTLYNGCLKVCVDGKSRRLGYDPYLTIPSDSAVGHLRTAEILLMNHPDFPTPYRPLQNFFRAVATVDESARAMKSAAFLCDAALVAVSLVAVRVRSKPVVGLAYASIRWSHWRAPETDM